MLWLYILQLQWKGLFSTGEVFCIVLLQFFSLSIRKQHTKNSVFSLFLPNFVLIICPYMLHQMCLLRLLSSAKSCFNLLVWVKANIPQVYKQHFRYRGCVSYYKKSPLFICLFVGVHRALSTASMSSSSVSFVHCICFVSYIKTLKWEWEWE